MQQWSTTTIPQETIKIVTLEEHNKFRTFVLFMMSSARGPILLDIFCNAPERNTRFHNTLIKRNSITKQNFQL